MPPKTRNKSSTKKASAATENNDEDIELGSRWEYEADGGWLSLTKSQSELINKELKAGKEQVTFTLSNSDANSVSVIFGKMVLKFRRSGWEKRVRFSILDETDYYCWQWEDEYHAWNGYQPSICVQLEKCRRELSTDVELTVCGRRYKVDLTLMQQTNAQTGVIRKVRRLRSDVPAAAESETELVAQQNKVETSLSSSTGNNNAKPSTSSSDDVATTSTQGRSTGKKRPATKVDDAGDNGELVTKKVKSASSAATAAVVAKSSGGKSSGKKEADTTVKTVVVKGKAPVDTECGSAASTHVYCVGSDVYDVMLNQTNVGNNNNKFYIIQLLESDKGKTYSVWNRWGRVGFKGQSSLTACGPDLEQAIELFCKKFFDKTKNEWSSRSKFVKYAGKYDLVKIDYNSKETPEEKKPVKSTPVPDSKLCTQLQVLIKLICDVKEMESVVMEMKYDAQKAPLGRLTTDQIKAGYAALKRIDTCVRNNEFGSKLTEACNDFYTRIPHYFGMSRPPVIRTNAEVKSKLDLLEALGDIEIALRVLKDCRSTENPIDEHYLSLHCELKLLDQSNPVFKVINDYLINTHAATHNQYKMKILEVFEVDRQIEKKQFQDCGNRMLLWHGSRLTNMVGILSQGLRIAPPEAPVTGYMFGKGIYFADMSSKSANYCFPSKTKNTGLLLLCEVSLGQCRELLSADQTADKLPTGFHSVKGLGRVAPDPSKNVVWSDGTVIPVGKPTDTLVVNTSGYTLNYNEYIVYSTRQVKMRYVLQVRFEF